MSCRPSAEPRIPRERKAKRLDWFVLRCVKIPIFLRTAPCGVPLVVFCTRTALRRVTCRPPPPPLPREDYTTVPIGRKHHRVWV